MTSAAGNLLDEINAVRKLSMEELRARYLELFGEDTKTRNKVYLFKRIAFRMQELKHGGLSEAARLRAEELAAQTPIRKRLAASDGAACAQPAVVRDPRLPPPGTVLRRTHDGIEHEVTVLGDGFEYHGERFKSLSVLASKIAGTRWNGYGFFGLLTRRNA